METNCPHLERLPPFYTTVGHVPVPGEFHEAGFRLQKPLNPLSLRDFPLSGGHRLHYIPAGGSTAAIFKENLADVPPRRLMHAKPALPLNPSRLQRQPLSGGTPLPLCSSGRLRYSISFGNLIAAPTRRVTAPILMWISSTYNLPYVGFSCAKPLNPSRLRYIGHCEESPLRELPAAVAVATGVRIFRLRCQYASSRQYHLP